MPTKTVSKKATSRPAVKKVAKKATTKSVKNAKKTLVYADHQTSFWLQDGQILNSLPALRDAFASMTKATYTYHTSLNHNDFATWVALVLDDDACAAALQSAKTPSAAKTIVVKHLKTYEV